MKMVEPDYGEILRLAHVRWLDERSAAASQAFERALMIAVAADHDQRNRQENEKKR